MIRHIAALQISSPRESKRDMLFSVGTGLIINQCESRTRVLCYALP